MRKRVRLDEYGKPVKVRRKKPPSHTYKRVENPDPENRRSRGPAPQFDWTLIRNEYVEGYLKDGAKDEFDRVYPTYEDLAKRHGVSLSTVRARGARERWRDLKGQQEIEVVKARQRKRADKIAHAAVQFDDNALRVGELGQTLIMSRLGEIATEMRTRKDLRNQAMERVGRGEDVKIKDLRSAVYHQEMLSLANAAEKFQQIGMRALGTEGANGASVQVNVEQNTNTTNVSQELIRDDKERATALVTAFVESGAIPRNFVEALGTVDRSEREDIVDAEVVDNTEDLEPDAPTPTDTVPDGEDDEDYELDPAIGSLIDGMDRHPSTE